MNGLILAGGQSRRMGSDKGLINYHGKPQREYMADLLNPFCKNVFMSCRPDQNLKTNYPILTDNYSVGPLGGIFSAFEAYPNVSWLIVPCDLPLMDKTTIQYLIKHRNRTYPATTFLNETSNFVEPLVAIWEATIFSSLKIYFEKGNFSPRQFLQQQKPFLLHKPNLQAFKNVNTPKDAEAVRKSL